MKTCSQCHISQSLDAFPFKKLSKDGRLSMCRSCERLYKAQRRRKAGIPPRPCFLERIWNYVAICEHGETCIFCCWPWQAGHDRRGYGSFTYRTADGRQHHRSVSNIIYELWNKIPLPAGKIIAHHCDNPPCGNPMHYFPATYRENIHDCIRKGRDARGHRNGAYTKPEMVRRGEQHGRARLTQADIIAIRQYHIEGMPHTQLRSLYGISTTHIWRIVTKKNWSHI